MDGNGVMERTEKKIVVILRDGVTVVLVFGGCRKGENKREEDGGYGGDGVWI